MATNISIQVSANVSNAQSGLRSLNTSLNTTAATAKKSEAAVAALKGQADKLKTSIAQLAIAATGMTNAIDVASEIITAKEAAAKLALSFQVISGSAKEAAGTMLWTSRIADDLGQSSRDAANNFMSFSAAVKGSSLEGEKSRKIFESVGRAMSMLGRSNDETAGALKALEQMVSKGTVQAEELRGQLGERLPGAFKLAAKALGLTTTQLGAMLQAGKVTAEDLLPRLAAELDKLYNTGEKARTLTAEWNRFKNAFIGIDSKESLFIVLNDKLGLNRKLSDALAKASEGVKKFSTAIESGKYDNTILAIRAIIAGIKTLTYLAVVAFGAIMAWRGVLLVISKPLMIMGGAIAATAIGGAGAIAQLRNEMVRFGGVTGTVGDLAKSAWLSVTDSLKNPKQMISDLVELTKSALANINAFFVQIFSNYDKEVQHGSNAVIASISAIGSAIKPALSVIKEQIKSLLKGVFPEYESSDWLDSFVQQIKQATPIISDSFSAVFDDLSVIYESKIKPITDKILDVIGVIGTPISIVVKSVRAGFDYAQSSPDNGIVDGIKAGVSEAQRQLNALFEALPAGIKNALSNLGSALKNLFIGIGDAVGALYTSIIKPFAQKISESFNLSSILDGVAVSINYIADAIKKIDLQGAVDWISSAYASLKSLFDMTTSSASDASITFSGLFGNVKIVAGVLAGLVEPIAMFIAGVVLPAAKSVLAFFSYIGDHATPIISVLNGALKILGAILTGVGAGLVKIISATAVALAPIVEAVGSMIKAITDHADEISRVILKIFDVMSDIITFVVTEAIGGVVTLGKDIGEVTAKAVLLLQDESNWTVITRPFIEAEKSATEFFDSIPKWIDDTINDIKQWFNDVIDWITSPFKSGYKAATEFFDSVSEWIDDTANDIKEWSNGVIDWITSPFESAYAAAGEFFSSVSSYFDAAVTDIEWWFNDVVDWIVSPFVEAEKAVSAFFDSISEWLDDTATDIKQWFNDIIEWILSVINSIDLWPFNQQKNVDVTVTESPVSSATKEPTGGWFSGIGSAVDEIGGAITKLWSGNDTQATESVGNTLSLLDRIKKKFNEISYARMMREERELQLKMLEESEKKQAESQKEKFEKSKLLIEYERKALLEKIDLLNKLAQLDAQMRKAYIGYDVLRAKAIQSAGTESVKQEAAITAKKTMAFYDLLFSTGVGKNTQPNALLADYRALGLVINEVKKSADQANVSMQNLSASSSGSAIQLSKVSSKQDFVNFLKPYAQQAIASMGLDPSITSVAIAQAALETEWGKRMPRRADGSSSFNLYGIKAGGSWQGDVARSQTTEFRNGRYVKEPADFRAYDNPADSVADWIAFLKKYPRYSKVVTSQNKEDFTKNLAASGYATDPVYLKSLTSVTKQVDDLSGSTAQNTVIVTQNTTAAIAQSEEWQGLTAVEKQRAAVSNAVAEQERQAFLQRQLHADQVADLTQAIARYKAAEVASIPVMANAAAFEDKLARGVKLTDGEMTAAKQAIEEKKLRMESLLAVQKAAVDKDNEMVASGGAHNRVLDLSAEQLESVARKYNSGLYAARDYRLEQDDIRQAFENGKLTANEYADAQEKTRLEYQKTQGPMAAYFAGLEEGLGSIETFTVDAMEGLRSAIVDGLVDGRLEFDSFVKDIKKKLAEIVVNNIIVNVVGNALGINASLPQSQSSNSGPNAGLSAGNVASMMTSSIGNKSPLSGLSFLTSNSVGKGLSNLLTYGAGKLGFNGNWIGSSASNMMQTSNLAYGISSIGGTYLGNALFNGKGQSEIGSSIGATAGSVMGSILLPGIGTYIGGALGGALGGLTGSLFGDNTPRQGNYSTSFSGKGFEDDAKAAGAFGLSFGLADKGSQNIKGADYQEAFDAMAALSNSISEFYGATLANSVQSSLRERLGDFNAWGKDLNTSFKTMFTAILDAADAAEGGVGNGMGHLLKVAVGELENDANKAATQVANAIVTINTAIQLFNSEQGKLLGFGDGLEFDSVEKSTLAIKQFVKDFARAGEEYADTATRIMSSVSAFTQAFMQSDRALSSIQLSGAAFVAKATAFSDAMASYGFSFDTLSSAQQAYYETFFTEEERAIKTRDRANVSIAEWASSIGRGEINTSAEFRAYVDSLDLLDESQQQAYLRSMQMVQVFVDLDAALKTLKADTADFIDSLQSESAKGALALAEMTTLFASWNMVIPESSDALYNLIIAGKLTEAQVTELAQSSDKLSLAFGAMTDNTDFIASMTPDISKNASALLKIQSFFEAWNVELPTTTAALYDLIQANKLTGDQISILADNADDLATAFSLLNASVELIDSLASDVSKNNGALDAVRGLFAEWNVTMPQTQAELYELIRAGALTADQIATLANNTDTLTSAFSALGDKMDFIASLQSKTDANENALGGLVALFNEWGMQLPGSADALYDLVIAGKLTDDQISLLAANTETVGNAFAALSERQSAALKLLEDAYNHGVSNINALYDARIEGIKASNDADKSAIEDAYNARIDALTKAHEAKIDGLNKEIDNLNDSLSDFENLIDSTTDALRGLTEAGDGIDETRQRYLVEAQAAITQFNTTGTLPDNIGDVVTGLGSVNQNDFATRADWQAAVDANKLVLGELQQIGVDGKSDTQTMIDTLKLQITSEDENFDALKDAAKKQYDRLIFDADKNADRLIAAENASRQTALEALSTEFETMKNTLMTDTNVLLNTSNGLLASMLTQLGNIAAADLAAVTAANAAAADSRVPVVTGGGISVPKPTTPTATTPTGTSAYTPDLTDITPVVTGAVTTPIKPAPAVINPVTIEEPSPVTPELKHQKFDESLYLATNPDVLRAVRDNVYPSGLAHFLEIGYHDNGGKPRNGTGLDYIDQFDASKYLARNTDVVEAITSGVIQSALEHYVLYGANEGRSPIGAFADGGVHSGGLRWVGEKGPELEYTGPSNIVSNNNVRSLLGDSNTGVIEELKALRKEVKELKANSNTQAQNGASLLKLHTRWDGAGLPPDREDYAKTTAENVSNGDTIVLDAGAF